ncbi:MAG: putative metal-binding motif-containing protein, partial [Myxococcota bacterium]
MLLLVACAAPEPETPCEAADWFADADGDGFGDAARPTSACERPRAHVADATDCDDARADVSPAGVEACDGVDQDCDGEADEGLFEDRYADADGDGWGDEPVTVCDGSGAPSGGDCDDDDATVSPGAQEVWYDGVDQDCDGRDDDADDDGWGVADD